MTSTASRTARRSPPGSRSRTSAKRPGGSTSCRARTSAASKAPGDFVEQHRSSRFAPALRQGDVLLWNPRAVHGSLPTRDERYSRKSLTAHYLPSHQGFDKHYKEYEGVRFYRNQPEYSLLNHVVYALKARLRQGSA